MWTTQFIQIITCARMLFDIWNTKYFIFYHVSWNIDNISSCGLFNLWMNLQTENTRKYWKANKLSKQDWKFPDTWASTFSSVIRHQNMEITLLQMTCIVNSCIDGMTCKLRSNKFVYPFLCYFDILINVFDRQDNKWYLGGIGEKQKLLLRF